MGHFNDIDHLAPIAYKMSQSGRARPLLLITDPFMSFKHDYRLQFLKQKYEIPMYSALKFHPSNFLLGWLVAVLASSWRVRPLERWRRLGLRAIRRFFFGEAWAEKILDKYNPAALAMESGQRSV